MPCYRRGGCGPYKYLSCSDCPAFKPEYSEKPEVMSICWETGFIHIYPETFFPCTMEKFKRFLKISKLDPENDSQRRSWLTTFFHDRIHRCVSKAETLGELLEKARKEKERTQEVVKSRRLPDGTPMTKEEYQAALDRRVAARERYDNLQARFREVKRECDSFRRLYGYLLTEGAHGQEI